MNIVLTAAIMNHSKIDKVLITKTVQVVFVYMYYLYLIEAVTTAAQVKYVWKFKLHKSKLCTVEWAAA